MLCPTIFIIGLNKLNQTEVEVKELQIELAELKPLMEAAAEETRKVIEQIAIDTVSGCIMKNIISGLWLYECYILCSII